MSAVSYNPAPMIAHFSQAPTLCTRIFSCCKRQNSLNLSNEQLNLLFREVAKVSFQNKSSDLIYRCAEHITLDQLLTALNMHEGDLNLMINRLEKCEKVLKRGESHAAALGTWQDQRSYAVRKLHALFETLLSAFSFVQIGREPGSSWEASHILQVYGQLLSAPFLLAAFLSTMTSFLTALTITTITTAVVAGSVFAYLKWFRLFPERVNGFHNLNVAIEQRSIPAVIGKDDEIDQALFYMDAGLNPLFVGEPGTGKTSLIVGVGQRFHNGNVPERLKGKQVIAGNAAHLLSDGHSLEGDRFQRFKSRLESEKKVAVGFDEVQVLMKSNTRVGDLFKSAMDKSSDSFGICFGATTLADYQKYIATDAAWMRRFPAVIPVSPSSKEHTIVLLRHLHGQEAPDIDVSDEILNEIFEETSRKLKEHAQPDASIVVFSQSVAEVRMRHWNTEAHRSLMKRRSEYLALCDLFVKVSGTEREADVGKELDDMSAKIAMLEEVYKKENESAAFLIRLKRDKEKVISETCYLARKILQLPISRQTDQLKKVFTILRFFFLPFIEEQLKMHPGTSPTVTSKVVQELVSRAVALRSSMAADAKREAEARAS